MNEDFLLNLLLFVKAQSSASQPVRASASLGGLVKMETVGRGVGICSSMKFPGEANVARTGITL